ncbi:GNAT family N-acetyltransferase [Streptomyces violaceusniger]|uniref:GNAT family N-acetyltransferase n=1 Tax=Streptomyces violaceusniger group TaxID=2839105 RepID=UPI00131B31BB|nr:MULTISPECIES: GNAT family N-acetyltransferase [Streptomyces]
MPLIRDIADADHSVVEELLESTGLTICGSYDPEGIDVVVAEVRGTVVGVVEFHLHCDFGHAEGRETHGGEQAFVLTLAVTDADRRSGVGRALLTEVARQAQEAGHTFLALVPQDGDDSAGRLAFFRACGLKPYGPERPGAAWGCPVSEILAGSAAGTEAR